MLICSRVNSFRALKALRLLRLMKLAKIMRASQLLSRLKSRMDIDYAKLTLASYLASFLLGAHWLACFLHLLASGQRTFYPDAEFQTWIDVLELETGTSLDSPVGQYIASLYWATVTMTNMVRFSWLFAVNTVVSFFCTNTSCTPPCRGSGHSIAFCYCSRVLLVATTLAN